MAFKAMALKAGDVAPDFTLPSTAGGTLTLSSLRGRKVVLYFYPKDQTPGCTREACDFRDLHPQLRAVEAVVVGVSRDTLASHQRFREKERLPFELVTDEDAAVSMKYGVWGEKLFYGKPTIGMIRSTFLLNEQGVIERAWSPVKVDSHAREVVAAVQGRTDVPRAPILAPAPSADDRPATLLASRTAADRKAAAALATPAAPAPSKPVAKPAAPQPVLVKKAVAKKPAATKPAAKKPVAKKPVAKKPKAVVATKPSPAKKAAAKKR